MRADFPVFDRPTRSAATARLPRLRRELAEAAHVIDAMSDAYSHHYANVHRGIYELSEDTTAPLRGSRGEGHRLHERAISARSSSSATRPRRSIWSPTGWGRTNLVPGTRSEPSSTPRQHRPVAAADPRGRRRARATWPSPTTAAWTSRTSTAILAAQAQAPRRRWREQRAGHHQSHSGRSRSGPTPRAPLVLVDAAQAAPHMPIDIQAHRPATSLRSSAATRCSVRPASARCGLAASCWRPCPPFMTGGNMIIKVTLDGAEWNEVPQKFEAGTPAIVEAIGLGAAIDYLTEIGMANVREARATTCSSMPGQPSAIFPASAVSALTRSRPSMPGSSVSSFDAVHPHDMAHHPRSPRRCGPRRPPLRAAGHAALRLHPGRPPRAPASTSTTTSTTSPALADAVRAAVTLFA